MEKRLKLEYTGLIILFLIIGGIFFFVNDLDLELTGNAFLNLSSYSTSNLSSFPTGTLSNVSVFGDGSVKLTFNPTRIGSVIDTGTDPDGWLNGIQGVFVSGDYAYVATNINDSMIIINITNKSSPEINGSLTDGNAVNDNGSLNGAFDVFISGDFAYVV